MSSETVSQLVIFTAALLIAGSVAGVLIVNVDDMSGVIATQSDAIGEELETEIRIISDAQSEAIYDEDAEEVTLYVKNIGGSSLTATTGVVTVFVNGEIAHPEDIVELTVINSENERWSPGAVIEVTVDASLDEGDNRASVVVPGGEDEFWFRVP